MPPFNSLLWRKRVNWLELIAVYFKAVFRLWFRSHLKHKSVNLVRQFRLLNRNGLHPLLLGFPFQPGPRIALLDDSERITHVGDPIQNLDIFGCIDTVDIDPRFTNELRFFSFYVFINYFSFNGFSGIWILLLSLGLISLLFSHVKCFQEPSINVVHVLRSLSLMPSIRKNFSQLFVR